MGKCLSCCKEDQNFQPNCTEDQVTSHPQHHEASSILRQHKFLNLKTYRPSATYEVSSATGSRKLSHPSDTSTHSILYARRQSLSDRLRKSNLSLYQRQSRANFDSQEDEDDSKSSGHFGAFRYRRRLSSPKLSIVSYYNSNMFFDPQPRSREKFNSNEIKIFSRRQSHPGTEKHISFSKPEYSFFNLEAKTISSPHGNTADRASLQQDMASFFSLPTINSSASIANKFAIAIEESDHLSKESKDSPHFKSHSHSTSHSPSMTQQSLSQTSPIFHKVGYSSSYKNSNSFALSQSEVTSGPFEEENISVSSQDEDKPSPIEIPKIRYITANTDTEEPSFPGTKAFNTHVEELKLDALLQKADHLRMNESGKMESFELLCDYKEKFKDEAEYMWRLVRSYGDMSELSTNTQEKKHYANIGKTLGERAVARAPMNGYCHLWYAVLCGQVSEFEGLQNKVNYGYCFKEHLDIAITLLPEEPFVYYLKGRYCYTISKLSWIEKKMAATLFGKIPSSNVQEALHNFLKAEDLHPGYSVPNYMYLAKCYIDLHENQNAWKVCHLALLLPVVTKEGALSPSHSYLILGMSAKVSGAQFGMCKQLYIPKI
uniref:regulator of microtubule dynamics protein 2 isoform X1 n=1 Tax=Ictidomys tridecemlineatus TaxID=43179 RepID=UPI001AA008AF|nr:regulator of microtubule dynamics protein 2 isoform X1 [Ictidomys tridecemlineatus]